MSERFLKISKKVASQGFLYTRLQYIIFLRTMDGTTVSDDSSAIAAGEIGSDHQTSVELPDTSTLTRRLARGEYTESIARKITEQKDAARSFQPLGGVSSTREEGSGEDDAVTSATNRPTLQQSKSSGGSNSSNNSNKTALDAVSEYISYYFKNAENYEEMLERSESQRDLTASLDKRRHGSSRFASPEGGDDDDEQEGSTGLRLRSSTPTLSDSQEAMAAVEAISNFRSLKEVKKDIVSRGSSLDQQQQQKKQKFDDRAQQAPSDEVDQQWDDFCKEKKKNKFNETGIESIPLPVSVDEFYKLVLEDKADNSVSNFMKSIGELDVECTLWQPVPTSTEPSNRTIQYIHPINAPMAPPTAAARKEQCLHKFDKGMCMETCTIVEDVPMADCFVVKDRLWVIKNPEDETGCIVSVTFQIDFIKGTMFRRIIENTTRGEYQKFWTKFSDMIKLRIGSSEEEELGEVVIELEAAAALLEGEGQEVQLSSVLGRIRTSSRKLSVVARRASVRNLQGASRKMGGSTFQAIAGKGKVIVLDLLTIVKDHFAGKDSNYVFGFFFVLVLLVSNILALRRISMMNTSITELTTQMEQLSQINEAILTKLDEGQSCIN